MTQSMGEGIILGRYKNNFETFLIGMHLCLSAFSVPTSGSFPCVAMVQSFFLKYAKSRETVGDCPSRSRGGRQSC